MDNENQGKGLVPIAETAKAALSYDEFIDAMSPVDESFFSRAALLISKIPIGLQHLSDIDPTGISSYFLGISNDIAAMIEKRKLQETLYSLYIAIISLQNQMDAVRRNDSESIFKQIELFIGKSLNEIQNEKAEYFRELLRNSLARFDKPFDEKLLAWNTIASLTLAEITILIYSIKNKKKSPDENGGYTESAIDISQDCVKINMGTEALATICYSLQGKGLLRSCAGTKIAAEQTLFYPSRFAEMICSYIGVF